ncbi:hypothetical protein CEUSTIGMA_g10685.t1 [Chlamydomonas eustigma]|uniref:Uncharacterized protein n=1 Tax=Chlamydomonas eustigma TaxID=1157962 RepID=A0A250XK07_9CHLO|nr:hypothetical protein CEUSTIGMA_g10685.t1 [Chlamydomonas eustigma]|eukprot:GAX83259.1 hypothetical protein CEUSTIGMA_g10685.t1 [Chlamydomonas eustigma]
MISGRGAKVTFLFSALLIVYLLIFFQSFVLCFKGGVLGTPSFSGYFVLTLLSAGGSAFAATSVWRLLKGRSTDDVDADSSLLLLALITPIILISTRFSPLPASDDSKVNCIMTFAFLLRMGVLVELPATHSMIQFLLSYPLFMFLDFHRRCSHANLYPSTCSITPTSMYKWIMTDLLLHPNPSMERQTVPECSTAYPNMDLMHNLPECMDTHGSANLMGEHEIGSSSGLYSINSDSIMMMTHHNGSSSSNSTPTHYCCSLETLYGHLMTRGVVMLLFGLVPMLLSMKQSLEAAPHLMSRAVSERSHFSYEEELVEVEEDNMSWTGRGGRGCSHSFGSVGSGSHRRTTSASRLKFNQDQYICTTSSEPVVTSSMAFQQAHHHDASPLHYHEEAQMLPLETLMPAGLFWLIRALDLHHVLAKWDDLLTQAARRVDDMVLVCILCFPIGCYYSGMALMSRIAPQLLSISSVSSDEWMLALTVFFVLGRHSRRLDLFPYVDALRRKMSASWVVLEDTLPPHILSSMMMSREDSDVLQLSRRGEDDVQEEDGIIEKDSGFLHQEEPASRPDESFFSPIQRHSSSSPLDPPQQPASSPDRIPEGSFFSSSVHEQQNSEEQPSSFDTTLPLSLHVSDIITTPQAAASDIITPHDIMGITVIEDRQDCLSRHHHDDSSPLSIAVNLGPNHQDEGGHTSGSVLLPGEEIQSPAATAVTAMTMNSLHCRPTRTVSQRHYHASRLHSTSFCTASPPLQQPSATIEDHEVAVNVIEAGVADGIGTVAIRGGLLLPGLGTEGADEHYGLMPTSHKQHEQYRVSRIFAFWKGIN